MAIPATKVVDSVLKPSRSAAKAAATRAKKEDAVYAARRKFQDWFTALIEVRELQYSPLVEPEDGDGNGVLEPEQLALVPTRDVADYRMLFDEVRDAVEELERQYLEIFGAREAAGEDMWLL